MCQSLWINNVEIDTVGALKKIMPNLILCDMYKSLSPEDDNYCLCPVDLVATANSYGFDVTISKCFTFYDAVKREPK